MYVDVRFVGDAGGLGRSAREVRFEACCWYRGEVRSTREALLLLAGRRCGLVRFMEESVRVCIKGTVRDDSIKGTETCESLLPWKSVGTVDSEDLLRL